MHIIIPPECWGRSKSASSSTLFLETLLLNSTFLKWNLKVYSLILVVPMPSIRSYPHKNLKSKILAYSNFVSASWNITGSDNHTVGNSVQINRALQLCFRISCFLLVCNLHANQYKITIFLTFHTKYGNSTLRFAIYLPDL